MKKGPFVLKGPFSFSRVSDNFSLLSIPHGPTYEVGLIVNVTAPSAITFYTKESIPKTQGL